MTEGVIGGNSDNYCRPPAEINKSRFGQRVFTPNHKRSGTSLNLNSGLRMRATAAILPTRTAFDNVALGKPAELNLRDGTTNLGVILHLLGPQRVTAGKVTVEVRSLVVPLRLTGALNNPYVNIDWKEVERARLAVPV